MVSFDGKTVIVTGGGRGIGRETCELLGELGANVVVNDVGGDKTGEGGDERVADEAVAAIEAAGANAVADYHDVGTVDGADGVVETALDAFGDLDAVYNNAGILRENSLVAMDEREFDEVLRVHLKGTFLVSQRAGRYWRNQSKDGVDRPRAVVNASSDVAAGALAAQGSSYGLANYAAAKAGILGLTRNAAEELGRYGVRVNAIWPGAATRLTETLPMELPDPEPVAHTVAYLASEDAEITGQTVRIMGDRIDLVDPAPRIGCTAFSGGDAWTVGELDARFPDTLGAAAEFPVDDPGN
jgi:NAD(P)-dependent dehydrogenase (short-subunit alcohol dehydrogenase family)